ncbi:MAG: TonB-dependent receptor, partial [Pseudomonadota bacterium]
ITKKPSAVDYAVGRLVGGTDSRFGGSVEINGALPLEGAAGRVGLFYEDQDTFRDNTGSESLIFDGGLSFDIGGSLLTVQATRYEQNLDGNRLRGVPVTDDGDFIASRRWNHNEPDDFLDLVSNNIQVLAEGQFSSMDVSWNAGLRYTDSEENQEYHEPRTLEDTNGDGILDFLSQREFRDQTRREEIWSFGANAIWRHSFGQVENRLLLGYDYFETEDTFDYDRARGTAAGVGGISLVDPVYGLSDRSTYTLSTVADGRVTDGERQGGYLINEATIGKFIAVLGARLDSFEDPGFDDEEVTLRAGLVYRVRDDVSLFMQWAESFEPQAPGNQIAERGGPFNPVEGEMIEAGLRTELLNGRIQTSASVYQIKRTNIIQNDPRGDVGDDGFDDLIAFGEVTSEGFEFDVAADITDNWVFTGSYGYNDTRITEDNGTTNLRNSVGERFANAPKHQLGFWTRYQIPQYDLALAFGGDYVDDQLSLSGQTVKSFTVFDASVIWEVGDFDALLRIDNLFDKTYAVSGFLSRTGHFPGEPRSVFLELSREW